MLYGILKSTMNTGADSELQAVFSTPLSVTSNQPSFVQTTMNLKTKASSQNVQRWEIDAEIVQEVGTFNMFLHTVEKGHNNTFPVRMPQPSLIDLTQNNITILANAGKNTDTLTVNGLTEPGEFVNIGNDPKVYVTLSAVSGTIRVFPPLRQDVTSGSVIKAGGRVTMIARYNPDVKLGITFTDGIMSSPGTVRLVEAL